MKNEDWLEREIKEAYKEGYIDAIRSMIDQGDFEPFNEDWDFSDTKKRLKKEVRDE